MSEQPHLRDDERSGPGHPSGDAVTQAYSYAPRTQVPGESCKVGRRKAPGVRLR
jgi:hypothetical protein